MALQKLWNRDFSLLVFGQTVSIFGNMILSFALPLYILDISYSPAIYGLVLALPYISLVITTPIGGIIADRLRKQRIMFWLDTSTTAIILLYIAASGFFSAILPIVIVKLMALNAIQGLYMPAVQASVPVLVPVEKLAPANAVVGMINAFSNMTGMAIAGILYASFGLFPILAVSAVCFAITAVMDLLIRIPYRKQESPGNLVELVKGDIAQSARFMMKEKPVLIKLAVVVFFLQVTLIPMIIVGIPVLITLNLGMGMQFVGASQSIMMLGGIAGGIIAGALGTRLSIKDAPLMLLISGLSIVPIGMVFLFSTPAFFSFVLITAATAFSFASMQIANIQFMTYIQVETPTELIGKVMSLIVILPFIASAIGSLIYGVFFEQFEALPWVVVFITVFFSAAIALYAYKLNKYT